MAGTREAAGSEQGALSAPRDLSREAEIQFLQHFPFWKCKPSTEAAFGIIRPAGACFVSRLPMCFYSSFLPFLPPRKI